MSVQPEVRLGFLGLGWIGRKRLDAVARRPGVRVAAIADVDVDRLRSASEQYPDAARGRDFGALLECDLDGIVIATPNGCHAEQARACLARRVPVFCQKPLGVDAAQTHRVIEAARSEDRLLGIDYCYRHVQGMPELRERIAGGELGEILSIDLTFHNAYGPDKSWCHDRRLAGGGCLLDLGIHLIDLALWLQAEPALELTGSRLFAQGARVRGCDGAIEDLALAEFRQGNDASVRLACSWHAHIGTDAAIGMRILGTRGGAAWRNVGGSFYDFQLDLFRGTTRLSLGSAPDEWGPRALVAWIERLRRDPAFDPRASLIARGAELIEEVYRS
jgi:predicted dehydrogenase